MFVEERMLTEALRSIPETTFLGSKENALSHGSKYRSISLDFGIWEMNGNSEDGSVYETTPQFILETYVRPSPHDEALQKADAEKIHNEILGAITKAFEGYQMQIYGVPIGLQTFGSSQAFVVSYNINLGPCSATFTTTS